MANATVSYSSRPTSVVYWTTTGMGAPRFRPKIGHRTGDLSSPPGDCNSSRPSEGGWGVISTAERPAIEFDHGTERRIRSTAAAASDASRRRLAGGQPV